MPCRDHSIRTDQRLSNQMPLYGATNQASLQLINPGGFRLECRVVGLAGALLHRLALGLFHMEGLTKLETAPLRSLLAVGCFPQLVHLQPTLVW